jgi:hypothetical protein
MGRLLSATVMLSPRGERAAALSELVSWDWNAMLPQNATSDKVKIKENDCG